MLTLVLKEDLSLIVAAFLNETNWVCLSTVFAPKADFWILIYGAEEHAVAIDLMLPKDEEWRKRNLLLLLARWGIILLMAL